MFQTLLSPLRSRFDLSPRSPTFPANATENPTSPPRTAYSLTSPGNASFASSGGFGTFGASLSPEQDITPEEFARDVLVELMRNSVEELKVRGAEASEDGLRGRMETLSEMLRIMEQDACTKDIFREMDGFLALMSVLASLSVSTEDEHNLVPVSPVQLIEPLDEIRKDCITRVFVVLSEAMKDSPENEIYFRTKVGYDSLKLALQSVPTKVDDAGHLHLHILSLFLALSLSDFSPLLVGFFTDLHDKDIETVDEKVKKVVGIIRHAGALRILWDLAVPSTLNDVGRYGLYKLFEGLFGLNHRNAGVLSSLGIVGDVFRRFRTTKKAEDGRNKERHVLQKLLRRLLEMGATTAEARGLFAAAIVDDKLDPEILDVARFGMKSRWVEHFSMEGPAAVVLGDSDTNKWRTLPKDGLSFLIWFFPSTLPTAPYTLFSASSPSPPPSSTSLHRLNAPPPIRTHLKIAARLDGKLSVWSSAAPDDEVIFPAAKLKKGRWTHLAFVWYQRKGGNPNLRLYIDGAYVDGQNLTYPRAELFSGYGSNSGIRYTIGDFTAQKQNGSSMSWCLASAYLLGLPLADDLPRLIHHLGPRYTGSFQDRELVKFLTYEASTSLNMYLNSASSTGSNQSSIRSPPGGVTVKGKGSQSPIVKALREGMSSMGLKDESVVFIVASEDFEWGVDGDGDSTIKDSIGVDVGMRNAKLVGDVFVVKAESLDVALWKIGGAAVGLRLVQLASTSHELSRTLSILTDGLKNSWQNSEDMERLRGYEILGDILRTKAQLINLTAFETLFEFLGINFNSPEQSTVVNPLAYRALALDFSLWSRTRPEIQRAHLDQFATLLELSRYKAFNWKQRLSKMNLVRKIMFALQADWYSNPPEPNGLTSTHEVGHNMQAQLVQTLGVILRAPGGFVKEDIKAVVAYLAANLHENNNGEGSPHSVISRFEFKLPPREKAELVLSLLVQIIGGHSYYIKFTTVLPMTRILLLLLGDRPSPSVAAQILNMISISIRVSSSFSRKFELVSGWSVLKTILPNVWDPTVNKAAFDLLLGRIDTRSAENSQAPTPTSATRREEKERTKSTTVSCTYILPTIIAALRSGLIAVANNCHISDEGEAAGNLSWSTETTMEMLIEELLTLHASSSTFRHIFESQQTTQLFIDAYKAMVSKLSKATYINNWNLRILEKLTHFGLALALDNSVGGGQKREILDNIQSAEVIANPNAVTTAIDPDLVVDNRSVRQRIASARFSIQVGERSVIRTINRMTEWRKTVQTSERKRIRKTVLDMREHRRQVSRLTEWTYLLTSERGLWPHHEPIMWRLDETEGPHRIRKKLEPQVDNSPSSRVDALEEVTRGVNPPEPDTSSIMQVEVPPWAEAYEISATEIEERQDLAEEIVDDKLRRIRHELEPGDVIEAVATVARIDGVDSSPGLLILGRTHIYMLDGVVENEDGEVIDAHDAPKRLLFIPGSIVELDGPQRAQRWAHTQIATCSDKKFLFRDVALEIYFKDSRSLLIVFLDKKRRSDLEHRLSTIVGRPYSEIGMTPGPAPQTQRTPMFGKMGSRVLSGFRTDELSTATRKWQAREISNFAYLSILNQISGRTPSDATQYPVFPWVLSDYTSKILDLNNPDSYRDLTKPMGALTSVRRQAAETRYSNLESVGEEPFHYGTHFSSSMIVCHFMIRLAPFTNMFKTLQGGDWDLPDRLFSDLPRAYESAAHDVRGDVRELIPEFFTCPEFLENSANHDFGVLQQTGERIHDVKLPPWAHQDPLLFITLNRRALESPVVSEHLPAWIDLIWGCNQRNPESLNVFHPLSYEGSIDLDAIKDDLEREATVGIIHNFGQTPRKIFTTPHPERYHHGLHSLPIGTLHGIEEDPHLLTQNVRCFKDLGPTTPVRELVPDILSDKMNPCPEGVLCLPQFPQEHVEWRPRSAELRIVVEHRLVQVIEDAFCNCAAFADSTSLVTGSSDYTVRLWKVNRGPHPNGAQSGMRVTLSHIMRVHTDEVTCVAASRAWSLIVSGSKDGSAALWDLNRGVYVRSIWHGEAGETNAVNLVAINESTGYIATCSRLKLCLHTVNGRHITTLDLTKTSSFSPLVPTITSMAFHEREYSHLGVLATGGPDGSITLRTWTADGTPDGEKAQWEFLTIRTMKVRMVGHNRPPAVTAIKFLGETLYHGEETGKSYAWNLPDS
ncbi:Beige protein-like protein 1 [Psilocybe cubensis]|uniref:Beige protein-like protein 1 n=2 Tax=Psilocybe cubensis TaxID=181762 RepID=A0ACB8GL35_PSICU|nr:Beige protein-like protein 1 [Psilocybe cubensis]KAH9476097.1 Beige protein-like protein 1 [Psilocybe cubensis]